MRTLCLNGLLAFFSGLALLGGLRTETRAGETLYNGIVLPNTWPPKLREFNRERPMPVPYLESPPSVIPIDVGRQLFVDDFLIEETTLRRNFHKTRFHPQSPVLRPDRPSEQTGREGTPPGTAAAMVFSDGVWFDPADGLFKMWYMGGYLVNRCYAKSKDGIHWEKPELDVVAGTNIVVSGACDTATCWLDLDASDPGKRYRMLWEGPGPGSAILSSADGIHWGDEITRTGRHASPTTFFYNPHRKVWVYSVRSSVSALGRFRRYWETPDPAEGVHWDDFTTPDVGPRSGKDPMKLPLWICADRFDLPYPGTEFRPEIYNLDAVAYESVLLGLFSVLRRERTKERPKIKEIVAGFSRDGFHWDRPFRKSIIGVSKEAAEWNAGNIQSAGGCCLVVGDELYFYVSGRRFAAGSDQAQVGSTGLAILRRDGFASMEADAGGGTLTTRPLRFRGRHLFVNVAAATGELRVEVLDKDGKVVPPFSRDRCTPVRADGTCEPVEWTDTRDLGTLSRKTVRFRFHLRSGGLYSFWVSPDASGASYGYVAAGGPGFTGSRDTIGAR